MAVRIRLHRLGSKHRPFYRVVVADSRSPRDGRFIESVGYYDPLPEKTMFKVDAERVEHWVSRGATTTDTVASLLKRSDGLTTAEEVEQLAKERRSAAVEEANKLAPPKPKPRAAEAKGGEGPKPAPPKPAAEAKPAENKPAAAPKPAAEAKPAAAPKPAAEAKPVAAEAPKAEAPKPAEPKKES